MILANRNIAIVGFTTIILLLLAPTRWTFLTQLPTNTQPIVDEAPRPVSIAGTPLEHDIEAQIANAIRQDNQSATAMGDEQITQWNHLIALQKQFPDQPAILATLLRLQMFAFHDDHTKTVLFRQETAQNDHEVPNTPGFLMSLETEAASGERISPNNAFFSFMRAAVLFTMGHDNEAVNTIESCQNKTEWNEYLIAEPAGSWKLADQTSHGPKSIRDLAITSAILYPHYARLRNAAISATYSAILLEEKGHTDEALRLRLAVMHLGGLMRSTQAQSVLTALVGIAISNIAIDRPGGAPMIKTSDSNKQETVRVKRLTEFTEYLRRTSHVNAIVPVTEDLRKAQRAREIISKVYSGADYLSRFVKYGCWWLAGDVLLQNLIILCLFTIMAGWVAPKIKGPNARKIATTLGRAVFIGASVPFLFTTTTVSTFFAYFGEALLVTSIAAVAFCLPEYRFLRNVEERKPVLWLCILVAILTTVILWPVSYAFGIHFGNLKELIMNSNPSNTGPVVIPYGIAVSLLLWIGVSIACVVRRIPIVPGLLQGFVKTGHIIALTMLIMYAVYAPVMTNWDQRLDRQVRDRANHEVVQATETAGEIWPGQTDFSHVRIIRD